MFSSSAQEAARKIVDHFVYPLGIGTRSATKKVHVSSPLQSSSFGCFQKEEPSPSLVFQNLKYRYVFFATVIARAD